jgi:hypothetical protein
MYLFDIIIIIIIIICKYNYMKLKNKKPKLNYCCFFFFAILLHKLVCRKWKLRHGFAS